MLASNSSDLQFFQRSERSKSIDGSGSESLLLLIRCVNSPTSFPIAVMCVPGLDLLRSSIHHGSDQYPPLETYPMAVI